MVNIAVKSQTHDAGSSLKLGFNQVFFRYSFIFSADILVISIIRFYGNYFAVFNMGFDHTLMVTAAIAGAGGINSFSSGKLALSIMIS